MTNIDSIDLVQGNLDIGYTKIPFFDKNKVFEIQFRTKKLVNYFIKI